MERRDFLTGAVVSGTAAASIPVAGASPTTRASLPRGAEDRAYMVDFLARLATPILGPMAQGRLQAAFKPELSPTWDGRDFRVAYLEAFGRLISGIAPWLALPDDDGAEGRLRARLRQQALASYAHSVDPKSPDYLLWRGPQQALVDSAYFTNALIRAPRQLWDPLDPVTKQRIVAEVKRLRDVTPNFSNWLLFSAMNEAFLLSVGEDADPMRLGLAIRAVEDWYLGDGWYGDGPKLHFDYYGSYVMHPMLVEILEVMAAHKVLAVGVNAAEALDQAVKRMQRYGEHLERLIGPDGSYAPIGRSLTYRTAAFQPLGLLAWRKKLPPSLPEGQVRAATLAAQRAVFRFPGNFDAKGYLTLGFTGHQPNLADYYSNAGSMYIATESLLALGLPASDSYWTSAPMDWTSRKAFSGRDFPRDYYVNY